MAATIIIIVCLLLLIAYLFDITSVKTKIPSVVVLLLVGWVLKQIADYFGISFPDLGELLQVLGTIGLILIVLEGALELSIDKSKKAVLATSSAMALLPMIALLVIMVLIAEAMGYSDTRLNVLNILPLTVISSAIAIPTARALSPKQREFVIYESSLSDIFGVLLFNFVAVNQALSMTALWHFGLQLFLVIILSFLLTLGLTLLLSQIKHHVKFVPIILLVVLIYALSKLWHLPGLLFVLLFGLFLGNIKKIPALFMPKKIDTSVLTPEVHKFSELTIEAAFLIRSMFFILFGFLIETEELLNADTFLLAIGISALIVIVRAIFLKIFRMPLMPLLAVAPRGLITILLFLSVLPAESVPFVNKSLVVQVIVLNALIMMIGMLTVQKPKLAPEAE